MAAWVEKVKISAEALGLLVMNLTMVPVAGTPELNIIRPIWNSAGKSYSLGSGKGSVPYALSNGYVLSPGLQSPDPSSSIVAIRILTSSEASSGVPGPMFHTSNGQRLGHLSSVFQS
jgi:hypothetical protein